MYLAYVHRAVSAEARAARGSLLTLLSHSEPDPTKVWKLCVLAMDTLGAARLRVPPELEDAMKGTQLRGECREQKTLRPSSR